MDCSTQQRGNYSPDGEGDPETLHPQLLAEVDAAIAGLCSLLSPGGEGCQLAEHGMLTAPTPPVTSLPGRLPELELRLLAPA